MGAMCRIAISIVLSHDLTRQVARGLAARGAAVLRAAIRAVIALIAGASAVLAALAAGALPALATVANAPRSTLASVIPATAIPRSRVTFAVYCTSARATSATLHGRPLGLTKHITMRPDTAAGDFTASVVLPDGIHAGTYHPSIECSDGTSTTARLLVPAFATAGGTAGGPGTWLTAGGLILIGMGTLAGGIALRRRHAGRSDQSDQSDRLDHVRRPDDFSARF
jgi:hypothetical protein